MRDKCDSTARFTNSRTHLALRVFTRAAIQAHKDPVPTIDWSCAQMARAPLMLVFSCFDIGPVAFPEVLAVIIADAVQTVLRKIASLFADFQQKQIELVQWRVDYQIGRHPGGNGAPASCDSGAGAGSGDSCAASCCCSGNGGLRGPWIMRERLPSGPGAFSARRAVNGPPRSWSRVE